jgi:subtilisin family serine protease/LAS superfamily LD-carboxypeptidase LdcB
MDPALRELLSNAESLEDPAVEAVIRLRDAGAEIPGVRFVARFGSIATCRLPARSIVAVRELPEVISLKASRALGPEVPVGPPSGELDRGSGRVRDDQRRPGGTDLTGAGVVIGAVDWGLDVDHPNFKHPDGSTRLLALWDQRDLAIMASPEPYGYGTVHTREQINAALRGDSPYDDLQLHPSITDRHGRGAHGNHVVDIAAGNGSVGPMGVAPAAELVFVHLAMRGTGGLNNLGDSVRLLEGIDFIRRIAGQRPWVVNVSAGGGGGPHDGSTLVGLALDELLASTPGCFAVNSAGNYYRGRMHASGVLKQGQRRELTFLTDPADTTTNEVEIWYDGSDELVVQLEPPGGLGRQVVRLGDVADLVVDGELVGRLYHRAHDPNNGANHIDAFLYAWAPSGRWRLTVEARAVTIGQYHAWIERDDACAGCQVRFPFRDSVSTCTTGTIANSRLPLVVGAYDAHSPTRSIARFSSSGPSRDGRCKPDLVAPGVEVLAARSAPRGSARSPGDLIRKSGTSMAAPQVTGAVALCLEAGGRKLDASTIRRLVLDTATPPSALDPLDRIGHGYLNLPCLVAAAHRAVATSQADERGSRTMVDQHPSETLDAEAWTGSLEQAEFRDKVLEAHILRSSKRSRPKRDLSRDELSEVAGTRILTARDTAAAAGRLLAASSSDLKSAQMAGDSDALRTTHLTVTSGYRSSEQQRKLWYGYFAGPGGHYERTEEARSKLPDGPHSDQAVAYMLAPRNQGGFGLGGRIAAPGFSNHQGGVAIDFYQERTKGHAIQNKSDDISRAAWRNTWFHRWLAANAATYGFHPLQTEEWHWEYRALSPKAAESDDTLLLAFDPARAYRELIYRPEGELAGWIRRRFEVIARPGDRTSGQARVGDVVLSVTLGRPGAGTCSVMPRESTQSPTLSMLPERPAPSLPQGQVWLRPRAHLVVDRSAETPAETGIPAETQVAERQGDLSEDAGSSWLSTPSESDSGAEDIVEHAKRTIRAQMGRLGTDEAAILAALRALRPSDMAEMSADAEIVDGLRSELSGAELSAAGAELARGRVGSMGRADTGRILASPARFSFGTLAAAVARDVLLGHQETFDSTGTGTIHGSRCALPAPPRTTTSDCTEYVTDVLRRTFAAKGQATEWSTILREATTMSGSGGLKGTAVIRALQSRLGWQAIFWSPDPLDPADGQSEHPFAYRIVRNKGTYYGITVSQVN